MVAKSQTNVFFSSMWKNVRLKTYSADFLLVNNQSTVNLSNSQGLCIFVHITQQLHGGNRIDCCHTIAIDLIAEQKRYKVF